MSQFSRPHPDSADNRRQSSPVDNTPIASRTLSESSMAAYSDEEAPAYALVYPPESERGLQAVPRSFLPLRIAPEEAHQEVSRTATAYRYVVMVIIIRLIAASIVFSNTAAFSSGDRDCAGENMHDNDASDEGHALSGGPEEPAAPRDSELFTKAQLSTTTRGDSGRARHKRRPEDTGNSASSAMDAKRGGQEGPSDDDGETL